MHSIHATSVEIDGHAVLIRGASGSGKSDLALRLIDAGAQLIADDQTALSVQGGRVFASAPPPIAGMLEVRGLGILRLPWRDHVPVCLIVDSAPAGQDVERMPEPRTALAAGVPVPKIDLHYLHASAAAKVRLAVRAATRDSAYLS